MNVKVDNSTKCTVFVKNAVKNILERIQKERVIWLRVSTMADAREMAVKRKQTERYRDPQLKKSSSCNYPLEATNI